MLKNIFKRNSHLFYARFFRWIKLKKGGSCLLLCTVIFIYCSSEKQLIALEDGLVIQHALTIQNGIYQINAAGDLSKPVLIISGDNIQIDFNDATLKGAEAGVPPNQFSGLGILIENATNVTIRNLNVQGYKVGVLARNVTNLTIENANLSYNYRQHLNTILPNLDYITLDKEQWLQQGAAIALEQCKKATIKDVLVTGGQNGLFLRNCQEGLFFNNTIQFNSGIGIGLFESSKNRIMHNQLDWNVRNRAEEVLESGAIFCIGASRENSIAHNSLSHSSRGILFGGAAKQDCGNSQLWNNDHSHLVYPSQDFCSSIQVEVPELEQGKIASLPPNQLKGANYILIDEWGPYDFRFPKLVLRDMQKDGTYIFLVLGPQGNWKAAGGEGFLSLGPKSGTFPATIRAKPEENTQDLRINLEYIGEAATDVFGKTYKRGTTIPFEFRGSK